MSLPAVICCLNCGEIVSTNGSDSAENPNLVLLYEGAGCWFAIPVVVSLGPLTDEDIAAMAEDRVKLDVLFTSFDDEFAWLV